MSMTNICPYAVTPRVMTTNLTFHLPIISKSEMMYLTVRVVNVGLALVLGHWLNAVYHLWSRVLAVMPHLMIPYSRILVGSFDGYNIPGQFFFSDRRTVKWMMFLVLMKQLWALTVWEKPYSLISDWIMKKKKLSQIQRQGRIFFLIEWTSSVVACKCWHSSGFLETSRFSVIHSQSIVSPTVTLQQSLVSLCLFLLLSGLHP